MGGGPPRENVLIVGWQDEPIVSIQEMKRRFPYLDITYCYVSPPKQGFADTGREVPGDLWKPATILITMFALPSSPEMVPNLKLIHFLSAGIDHAANHPMVKDTTIPITTSSGIHGPPITEWIIMTTLVASRRYGVMHEWQKQRRWAPDRSALASMTDWAGKTVGIAGYGSIGRQAARVFAALGARVHAYTASPRTTPAARADQGYYVPGTGDADGNIPAAWYSGADKTSLHTFLASGLDALVVSLPLTPATRHVLGAEEFALLGSDTAAPEKKKCFLINIARGQLLDQPALVDALNAETLAGAALDVTDPEPLPEDDPLWTAKNVIITPHISGMGTEYTARALDLFMANWARHERGEKMFNLIDRERGY